MQRALESLKGVDTASVNLLSESASIRYDTSVMDVATLIREVEDCGFDAQVRRSPACASESLSIMSTGDSVKRYDTSQIQQLILCYDDNSCRMMSSQLREW